MALESQVVPIAFTKGLDTHTQRKLLVPGKWDKLLNLTQVEDDALQRRPGHAALVATGNGNGLATLNNELLTISGSSVSSVSQTSPATAVARSGRLPNVFVDWAQVVAPAGAVDSQDVATGDGYTCYVWREYAGVLGNVTRVAMSIVEEASGASIVVSQTIRAAATMVCPRVVYSNGAFFIFSIDSATTSLYCTVVATSAPTTVGTNTALVASASLSPKNYDACVFNSQPMVAYVWTDGTTSVRALTVARSGTTPSISLGPANIVTEANVTNASIQALTCAPFPGGTLSAVCLLKTAGGAVAAGMLVVGVDTALATTTSTSDATAAPAVASACHIGACADPNGVSLQIFSDQISSQNTSDFRPVRVVVVDPTGGIFTITVATPFNSATFRRNAAEAMGPQGPFLYGKPFSSGQNIFVPVFTFENQDEADVNSSTANAQCSFYVLRVDSTTGGTFTSSLAGSALYGRVGTINGTPDIIPVTALCSTPAIGDGFRIGVQEFGDAQFRGVINITPVGLSALTLTPNTTTKPMSAQVQGTSFIAGGALGSYDGQRVDATGFPLFPEGISVVVAPAGTGAGLTVGVHQIVAVYAYTDGAGQIQRSAPSPAVSFTVANTTDTVTVIVPSLLLTSRSDVVIELYMTLASGITFYRFLPSYTAISNTLAAATVTITNVAASGGIVATDAVLASSEPLYTQPSQSSTPLPNFFPGPVSALGVSQNRLWYIKSDSPGEVGFSQEPIPKVGVRFHPSLRVIVPMEGGKPTAVAQLDEKTIIFTEKKIYSVFGTGPNVNGEFNNYSQPQDIQSDVGCVEPLSILSDVPEGIYFKSPKGWYLLSRDLSVKYIGDAVARWDSLSVISAVALENTQEYRFLLSGADADELEGITLSYAPLTGQWSQLWYRSGVSASYVALSSAFWPAAASGAGRYVTISAADGLNQDTPGVYSDDVGAQAAVGIRAQARTGWLALAQLEGFQRVRELYLTTTSNGTSASLLITVDYDDIYSALPISGAPGAYQFTASLSDAYTASSGQASDIRHKLSRQKCKSIAFTFAETGSAGASVVTGLQALALEVGLKTGVNKLPATQTVGP